MVDIDGKIKYSNIVRVNFDKPEQVSILPNPAADIVIIKGVSGYKQLRIIDVSGRVKYQQAIKKSIEEINISQLPAGIYIVQLQNDNGTTALKLIKQ